MSRLDVLQGNWNVFSAELLLISKFIRVVFLLCWGMSRFNYFSSVNVFMCILRLMI
jgi:hypothetical protein